MDSLDQSFESPPGETSASWMPRREDRNGIGDCRFTPRPSPGRGPGWCAPTTTGEPAPHRHDEWHVGRRPRCRSLRAVLRSRTTPGTVRGARRAPGRSRTKRSDACDRRSTLPHAVRRSPANSGRRRALPACSRGRGGATTPVKPSPLSTAASPGDSARLICSARGPCSRKSDDHLVHQESTAVHAARRAELAPPR